MPGPMVIQRERANGQAAGQGQAGFDPLQGAILGDPLLDGGTPGSTAPTALTKGDWAPAWNTALDKKPEDDPKPEKATDPARELALGDGELTLRTGGGAAGGGRTTKFATDKFDTKTADGSGFTIGEKGVVSTFSGKGSDGVTTTGSLGLGSDGLSYGNTHKAVASDGTSTSYGSKVALGEKGLVLSGASKSVGADGKATEDATQSIGISQNGLATSFKEGKAGVDVQLGKTTQVGVSNAKGTGITGGYDSDKGEVIVGGTYGDWKGQVNIGKNGGTVAAGNKQYGGSVTLKIDEHTLDVGASGYVGGFGLGGGYHAVTDKETLDQGGNAMLGPNAVGQTNTNETGWSGNAGIKLVHGGGFSNDVNQTSFSTTHLDVNDPKSVQRAMALRDASKGGKGKLSFDQLQSGESFGYANADGGGWEAGANAFGVARYGYNRNTTDIDKGALAKRDNGDLVASHTSGDAKQTAHDYGALWGVYGGKTGYSNANEQTIGVSTANPAAAKALEQYANGDGEIDASSVKVGQEIVDGLTVDHTRDLQQSGYTNDQSLAFGAIGYNHSASDVSVTEAKLTQGGDGAVTQRLDQADRSTGGSVLGVGGTSSSTETSTSTAAFAGANKEGQSKAENAADFKRLQDMSDKGAAAVDLTKMKSGETIALDKAASSSNTFKTAAPLKTAGGSNTVSSSAGSSQEITKLGSGASIRQTGNKEISTKAERDYLWGLASGNTTNAAKMSGTVQVAGGGGDLKTLQAMVKSGAVSQAAVDVITKKDEAIAAKDKQLADARAAGNSYAIKIAEGELKALRAERQDLVDQAALAASLTLRPGQKIDGVTVQGRRNTMELSSSSASSSWWGMGTSTSGKQKMTLTEEDKLVKGGTQSMRSASFSDKAEVNDAWLAKAGSASATSGPNGSSLSFGAYQNSSADTKGVKMKIDLPASDVKAITAKFNADGDPTGFWARAGGEAAKGTVDPTLKSAFTKVKSPADFSKLSKTQQQAFVDGLLADASDGNPFEVLAAVELMGLSEAKAESYMKMFQKTAAADADGDGSRVGEQFVAFLLGLAKTDKELAGKLKDRISVGTL